MSTLTFTYWSLNEYLKERDLKRSREQNNGCARALLILENFFTSSAKQQSEMIKLCVEREIQRLILYICTLNII